jgi:formylglycine-generating enzyme required for sulfatase activity
MQYLTFFKRSCVIPIVLLSFCFSLLKAVTDSPGSATQSADMIYVQGGDFNMGSNSGEDDEKPVHKVHVDGFYVDKYEVTNAQFCEFLNAKGNQKEGGATWLDITSEYCKIITRNRRFIPKSGYGSHPVIGVTWYGARAYAQWAGKRLPTEAEWEYACRGGSQSRGYIYSGSNNLDAVAWYSNNSGNKTHPVGRKQSNELGLYDMSGNVREWCADWYDKNYYSKRVYNNPKGPSSGTYKVIRGGSWIFSAYCRSAYRSRVNPDRSYISIGFRCVR